MMRVVTAEEMRELDRRATAEYGIPSLLLMESAGAETVRELLAAFPAAPSGRTLILCGRGNNGGDGFVVARRLLQRGAAVTTVLLGAAAEVRGDARLNLEILQRLGAPPVEIRRPEELDRVAGALADADLVVDALLGTGTRGAAQGLTADCIRLVNEAARPVVAVDIPSGLSADEPSPAGPVVQACLTVTFAFPKPGLLLYPGARFAGRLRVADIGIPAALWRGTTGLHLLEAADLVAAFPLRDPAGHKGTYGHVLVIAGAAGKTGAAALTAEGALRAGAGLVTLATPGSLQDVLAGKLTEVMTEALPETETRAIAWEARERILALAEGKSAVALGPGLGTHASTAKLVRELVRVLPLPVVVDADGLNALAGQAELLRDAAGPRILTPHPAEMARLIGTARDAVVLHRTALVPSAAQSLRATLVLKTARTLIGAPGGDTWIVPTGNPGMATGGTGDLLTGMIAGLLAQGREASLAAQAGAYVHGLAGDVAAERFGQEAMTAGDLLAAVPEAIRRVKGGGRGGSGVGGRGAERLGEP
jgi:NAD(P)H-hydrate epimerase